MVLNPNFVFIESNIKDKRIIALQGGTRSGKTYSALQWIIRTCSQYQGMTISIVRKTLPALKSSALRDFIEILQGLGWYNENDHNKTENTFILNKNLIEFFSIDDAQKIRGRKRDILFVNEANEVDIEDWRQLLLRTSGKIIIDYNPSDFEHWIYDQVLTREDCATLITTYKDNPHLPDALKREIESLKDADPEYWKIFGLGERGQLVGLVFNNWREGARIPDDAKYIGTGLDWGFTNDPTAAVRVYKYEQAIYVKEELYERGLTNPDVSKKLELFSTKQDEIFADSSEPKSIEEVHRYGWNIQKAIKGPDSVNNSIDILRRYQLVLIGPNLIREFKTYKWKTDKAGKQINEPVDFNNHLIDALRYLAIMKLNNRPIGKYQTISI